MTKRQFNKALQKGNLNFVVDSSERSSEYIVKYIIKSMMPSKIRHSIELVDTELGRKEAIKQLQKSLLFNTPPILDMKNE